MPRRRSRTGRRRRPQQPGPRPRCGRWRLGPRQWSLCRWASSCWQLGPLQWWRQRWSGRHRLLPGPWPWRPGPRRREAAARKVLVVRKPAFRLPTACPACLPVLLYLRMAEVPFEIEVDTSSPNSEHIPYVKFGDCAAFNNEKGGVIQYLRNFNIIDLNSDCSSSSVEPTKVMISTSLADAVKYELWVVSDGSTANDIYFSDLPWITRKILHLKRQRDEKQQLCLRLKMTSADMGQEIYRRADAVYDVLSEILSKDGAHLFGNSPKDVDALFLGHALFVLNVLPDTSVLRSTLQKHEGLVRYAEHNMYILLGILPSGGLLRTLPYVAYDVCVMGGQLYYEEYISLKEYKLKYNMLVPSDVLLELDEDGCNPLPGETDDPSNHLIASERCKKLIRTVLKPLRINELLQICFENFDEDNIVVTRSGKAKFRNVTVISCLRGLELMKRHQRNFKSAWKVIRDLFKCRTPTGIRYNIPVDIQHLLDLIENEFEARSVYPVHASLVPLATCSGLFQKMYETIKCVLPYEEFRKVLKTLPYGDEWKNKVQNNALLSYPIVRRPASYEVPPDKPNQNNLNKYQKGCLSDLGIVPGINQKKLEEDEKMMIKQLRLFDYWRNRTVHRMEPFRDWTEVVNNNAPARAPYKAEGSELANYVKFPMSLTWMQSEIRKRKDADGHMDFRSFF